MAGFVQNENFQGYEITTAPNDGDPSDHFEVGRRASFSFEVKRTYAAKIPWSGAAIYEVFPGSEITEEPVWRFDDSNSNIVKGRINSIATLDKPGTVTYIFAFHGVTDLGLKIVSVPAELSQTEKRVQQKYLEGIALGFGVGLLLEMLLGLLLWWLL